RKSTWTSSRASIRRRRSMGSAQGLIDVARSYLGTTEDDPRFFELILDHEGLLPEETLFIDDTAANIKVAQSLGINTYHISREELVRNLFVNGVLKDGVI
ncbi:MAG: HAD-IA family hydrolase, partial [Bacteroidales bacterium]|nr:HAD-IA family hydrolase [Bacteroidales bacterium]